MRSARHRVIWLAAVALALAAGVMLGSRGLAGPTVSGLRADNQALQQRIDRLDVENRALAEKLSAADRFDVSVAARVVRDSLAGRSVVLFRTPDADDADLAAVTQLIGQAGGAVAGTIGLTPAFVRAEASEKLRSVVNSPIVPAGTRLNTTLPDPNAQAGDLLGIALLINRDPKIAPVDDTARETVLSALRSTGFLTYDQRPGAANTAVVVTGGALPDDAGNQGLTVARFAAALAPHGWGVVLAGRDGSASGAAAVSVARSDSVLGAGISTVDDIDAEAGRITTVLALQDLIAGGPPGRYGRGAGAGWITAPR